jgi:DNA-directed RNA polymerase specialized sigma24 family protein
MEYLENSNVMEVEATQDESDNQAHGGKLVSEVAEGIASLPALEREALILSEYEGLELDEIAAIVGADVRTVAERRESAHQRLRNVLANHLSGNQ